MKRHTGRKWGCFCLAVLFCLAGCAQNTAVMAVPAEPVTLPTAETKGAALVAQPVKAEAVQSAQASTMHLEKVQGTMRVEDIYEKNLPVWEGMQLYSGYELATAVESLAWISLDKAKAVKLDVLSSAQVRQHGKNLEINLTEGSLFFDISQPLEADESLKIRTSTMVMGIRGTSGWVSISKSLDVEVALLEGIVEVECTDAQTGNPVTVTVENGQILTLTPPEETGEAPPQLRLETLAAEKVPVFAAKEVAESAQLQARIAEKSPVPVEAILAVAVQEEQPPAAPPAPVVKPYTPPEPEYEEEAYEDPPAKEEPPAAPDTSTGTEGGDGSQGDSSSGNITDDEKWLEAPSNLTPYTADWWYWQLENNWDLIIKYKDNWSDVRPEGLPDDILWPPEHQELKKDDQTPEQTPEQSSEQTPEQTPEQGSEQTPEQGSEQTPEQASEQTSEQTSQQGSEQTSEQPPEQEEVQG